MKSTASRHTWQQVADIVRQRLAAGDYASGAALPSYRALASELGVSLSVCQRAMSQLRAEGVVQIAQGRGSRPGDPQGLESDFSFYGVIHPYNPAGDFGRLLNAQVLEAFSTMRPHAFPLISSSLGDSASELTAMRRMTHNRVRGLLLSPATQSANAAHFEELSRRLPVVLFDQELPGSDLPLVKFDYARVGQELGDALRQAGRRHALVLYQTQANRSLQELTEALSSRLEVSVCELDLFGQATAMARSQDGVLLRELATQVGDALVAQGCDALFCPYDALLDMVILNGLPESALADVQLATLSGCDSRLPSPRFLSRDVWQWEQSLVSLIGAAAHRLVRWTINHHAPTSVKLIPMRRIR